MNLNYIILLLFLSTLSTARYLPANYVNRRRSLHWRRGPDHSWDVHDTSRGEYICDVTKASPFKSDVEDVAYDLGGRSRNAMCTCDIHYECTTVATKGSAEAGICNIWNGGLPCRAVGKIVSRIGAKCAHRFWGDQEQRVSGKAVFDWGVIVVS